MKNFNDDYIHEWVHSLNVNTRDREKITILALYSLYNSYDDVDYESLQDTLIFGNSSTSSDNMRFVIDKKNKILNSRLRSESPERTNYDSFNKIDYIYILYIILGILFLYRY